MNLLSRHIRFTFFALALLSLAGCGEEVALLEVEITLPLSGGEGSRTWAFAEVIDEAEGDFMWPAGRGVPEQLLTRPTTLRFGVPAKEDTGMRMRVSFCLESNCEDSADAIGVAPQIGYRIERSHYLLETTYFKRDDRGHSRRKRSQGNQRRQMRNRRMLERASDSMV